MNKQFVDCINWYSKHEDQSYPYARLKIILLRKRWWVENAKKIGY
jgi:hypothetical protein